MTVKVGDGIWDSKDDVHWGSSFVIWCMEQTDYEGTDNAGAWSWNPWGRKTSAPKKGCISLVQKSNRSIRHVAFYDHKSGGNVYYLDGNQSDSVCIQKYKKSTIREYR